MCFCGEGTLLYFCTQPHRKTHTHTAPGVTISFRLFRVPQKRVYIAPKVETPHQPTKTPLSLAVRLPPSATSVTWLMAVGCMGAPQGVLPRW